MIINRLAIGIFLMLAINLGCLAQSNIYNSSSLYRVLSIDSTNYNYYIFISSEIEQIDSIVTFLDKEKDCNYLSFSFINPNIYCIISEKHYCSNRNIYVGDLLNLTLKQAIISKTIFPSTNVYTHIGFGDYLKDVQSRMLLYSDNIYGLFYTVDSTIIKFYKRHREELFYFDSQMLYIWMNIAKSDMCYSKWLENIIANSKQIEISDVNHSFFLYSDADGVKPLESIELEDFIENDTLKVKLYYKNKKNSFIRIGDSLNFRYGWVKKNFEKL